MRKTIAMYSLSCSPSVFAGNWGQQWGNMIWGYQPPAPVPVDSATMLATAVLLIGLAGLLRLRKR